MKAAPSTNPFDEPLPLSRSSSTASPVSKSPSIAAVTVPSSPKVDSRRPSAPSSAPPGVPAAAAAALLLSDDDLEDNNSSRKLPTDLNERFLVLVERYRELREKNSLLKKAYRQRQAEVDGFVARARQSEVELRKAVEAAEMAQFNYDKVVKQVKALQLQIKEDKEKASQGGWFNSGAKADLERCKSALVASRGELRRKIQENESLHKQIWEKSQESERAMLLLRDKIHSLTNEIRELHEGQEIKQKIWEEQKRELRAAKEDSDRQWAKTEEERARTVATLNETKAALARMTQGELAAREALTRIKVEIVMFDDGSPLARFDAPSTCYLTSLSASSSSSKPQPAVQPPNASDDGWRGIIESHRALGTAFANKSRMIEASWNTYGGGGDEEVSLRTSVRALWAWSGRANPAPGLASIHALKRVTLALASLKLRPTLSEAARGLEHCLHSVTGSIIDANLSRVNANSSRGVHASSRPHLARRYEFLLEQLRDAYRETRSSWAAYMAQEASSSSGQSEKSPSTSSLVEKAIEVCISSCGAALALARQVRSEQEAGKAFARGKPREGTAALATGWATETQQSVHYLQSLNSGIFEAQSVPYETALENARYLIALQSKEAKLVSANAALQAELAQVLSEKERIAEQWARTTDQLRQQRAQLSRMALEENQGTTIAATPLVDSGSPGQVPAQQQTPLKEGTWKVRRVPGAGTGDDEDIGFGGITRRTRKTWEERVARSEAEAAKWHHMYLDLMRAAAQDKEERQSLRHQAEKTEQVLGSWNEEKDALHKGYQDQLLVLNDHLIKQTELISQKDNEITLLQSQRVRCVSCGGWNTVGWLLQNGGGKKCKYGNHPSGLNYAKMN